jgi:hypothetical protein
VDEDIQLKYVINDFISMSYRSSLSFATLDILHLHESGLLTQYVEVRNHKTLTREDGHTFDNYISLDFPDFFFFALDEVKNLDFFLYGFLLNSYHGYRSSSSFGTFDPFLTYGP